MGKHSVENLSWFEPIGKSIFESLPIGVVVFDKNLKIIKANHQANNLLRLADTIDSSLANGTDVKIWHNWKQQLHAVIFSGKQSVFDNVTYTHNSRTRLLQILCAQIRATQINEIIGGVVIIEDVTDKINTERQLAAAEKLASLGKLSAKVAHELNNPMDGILRYLNLAIRNTEQNKHEKVNEYLKQCRGGIMRMMQIVSELLEFSRSRHMPLEKIKIDYIINDAVKTMLVKAEAANIKIHSHYATDIPQMKGGNLFQVFCNLIKNAINAMPNGGELNITTKLLGNTISVEFSDSGTGFKPEYAELIFEPFFTTNEKGKGTGLGLAICKDIVERYNGHITAQNNASGGCIFTVFLPLQED